MKKLLLIAVILLSTIYAQSQNNFTQGSVEDYAVKLTSGTASGATYEWSVSPSGATFTDLSAITDSTATITWDGTPGSYTLAVQVVDGNGCLSEEISQQITILSAGSAVFASTYPNTETCSDLAGNTEGSSPAHSESNFAVIYNGSTNLTSAIVTIQNPDNYYVGLDGAVLSDQSNPEVTLTNAEADNQIDFSVTDSWENTGSTMVYFTIKLISVKTSDSATINADNANDITRTIGILPKPVITF